MTRTNVFCWRKIVTNPSGHPTFEVAAIVNLIVVVYRSWFSEGGPPTFESENLILEGVTAALQVGEDIYLGSFTSS